MKEILIVTVIILCVIFLASCSKGKPVDLKCMSIKKIENLALEMYNADEIIIESKWLKEEIYFKGLSCFYITIVNGKTQALNFKELPADKYRRFDNYEEIENQLKQEGLPIVNKIKSECDLKKFDQIVVVFAKEKSDGTLFYRFGNRYKL